jgi:quercetin dioxygenase-like cupin family protein
VASHRRYAGGFRWEGVPVQPYKEEGTHFRGVSRQLLFGGEPGGESELRYFEVEPGGHTSLERHEHAHEVMILRGRGRALAGDRVVEVRPFDLVRVPPRAWHQFRAADDEALGFLCLVDRERDRPQRPDAEDLAELRARPELAGFIRV